MMQGQEQAEQIELVNLPRGGLVVTTSQGPVQFGVPPETIKDSLLMPFGVPGMFVLTRDFFSYERGISFAEMEFPIYFNFFVRKQRLRVVGTKEQRDRILTFMQESMFGPEQIDLSREVEGSPDWLPDLRAELDYFRRHPFKPGHQMTLEDVLDFTLFDEDGHAELSGLHIHQAADGGFHLVDPERGEVRVPADLSLPPRSSESVEREDTFHPPAFGVTILGSGHGFDPRTKTTGFILWTHGRGILVDPPVDTTEWLRERDIPPRCIDALILTHVHGDHDAGTLQKALLADRIRLYSTYTVYESFLRKSNAITGLETELFGSILDFRPVPIGRDITINGATFRFTYTLHSIPTLGFEVWFGGRSIVYTGDTLNDPEAFERLAEGGILPPGRRDALLDFPWHHDLIIHEAGIPPLHTPVSVLEALPDDVKSRLYVVHTTADKIPEGSGLTLAPEGLDGTLSIELEEHRQGRHKRYLMAMAAVDHFRDMPPAKAIEFLDVVEELHYAKGDFVIRKNTPGDCFYMILNGKAAVFAGEVSRKVFVMFDYFGEASLLRDMPRSADVVALTDLTLLAISKENFLAFIEGSSVYERMMRLFRNRDFHTWSLMDQHPILRSLNTAQRNELQSFMEHLRLPSGGILVSHGAPYTTSALIASGVIEETRPGKPDLQHAAGALVTHADAVVGHSPSPYTLRAVTNADLFLLPAPAFSDFLTSYPGLYLRLVHQRHD